MQEFLTYTPPTNNQAFVDGIQNNPVAEGPLWEGNWPAFDKASNDTVNALMNGQITIDQYQNDGLQGRRHRRRLQVGHPAPTIGGRVRRPAPRSGPRPGSRRSRRAVPAHPSPAHAPRP